MIEEFKTNIFYDSNLSENIINDLKNSFNNGIFKEFHSNESLNNSIVIIKYEEFIKNKSLFNSINNYYMILIDKDNLINIDELPKYVFDIINEISISKILFSLNKSYISLKNQIELNDISKRFELQTKELHTIHSIGISLSTERDVGKLLETILLKCREITESDSGSLYIVEEDENIDFDLNNYFSNKKLIFKLAQNSTIKVDFKELVLPLNKKSISGYVALTGKPLLIKDAYHLPEDAEYSHNKSFDQSIGYKCVSMLIVPMKNQKDEIIGVIQLINKKRDFNIKLDSIETIESQVIEYNEYDQELVSSLASQAAILIDNTKLYYSIRNLFEGFIKASVTAIEARDPTTSGHSERVADLTVGLAQKVDSDNSHIFGNIKFSKSDIQQIKYASLLHDFGKIGVKEDVLVKAKKLYPYELDSLIQRFKYIRKCMELNFTKAKLQYIIENPKEKAFEYFKEIDADYQEKVKELDDSLNIIVASNEPTILAQESSEKLKLLSGLSFEDFNNEKIEYLNPYELESLSILKGSLRDIERREIESHVTHTYEFLSKIPWTNEFKLVPSIAYSHHEKLDGTGYPRGIKSEEIPIPSKMMAISDIYDALTASDRPYKKALPAEKALDILGFEVKAKKLDENLFKIFVDAKVYEINKDGSA
ncbi:MAG: HD domain-containing phosphohydrolase [Candidatus Sericytochromatia bacterium]